jgi:hypothetical protein
MQGMRRLMMTYLISKEMLIEIEEALHEVGGEILHVDYDKEVIKISVDIRLRSQAFLIMEDIRRKHARKAAKAKANAPFIRASEIYDELQRKE